MRLRSPRFLLSAVLVLVWLGAAAAQTAVTPTSPAPATPSTTPNAPAAPPNAEAPKADTSKADAAKPAAPEDGDVGQAPGIAGDTAMQTLEVPSRQVAVLHGSASWEDGFKTIQSSISKIQTEIGKAGIKQSGRPIAVFTQVNENSFTFDAMVPIAEKPEGKTELGDAVKLATSPGGKALKFQHRGAYDDIESTYDLITAFLDEKGLKAQDYFIEEYLTDLKDSDDPSLEVDIYVFLQ